MDIFVEKVNHEIARAAEYDESNVKKKPEIYRVQIQSLRDSVSLIHVAAASKKSLNDDIKQVLADAQSMLHKLEVGLGRAESEEKLATSTLSLNSSKLTVHSLTEIPEFYGSSPLDYRSFMNLFMSKIKCNPSLTEIEKLVLLKNYLKGEAYDVINEIPITESSFSLALDILEEMYCADEEECIKALFDRLKALPPVSTDEIAEIRKTYWKLEAILRSFKEYGELANENRLLKSYYLEKFVNASSIEIGKLLGCKLSEIREQIRLSIRARKARSDVSDLIFFENSSSSNIDSIFFPKREHAEKESAFTNKIIDSAPSNENILCNFCFNYHHSEDCILYSTVPQEKKQQHQCLKCFRVEHEGKPCVKLEKCEFFDEKPQMHCGTIDVGSETTERLSVRLSALLSDPKPSHEPLENYDFRPITALTTCTVVESPLSGKRTSVRLVIVSGSSSMISESVVNRLGLSRIYEIAIANLTAAAETTAEVTTKVLIHVLNAPPVALEARIVKDVCDKPVVTPTVAEFKKDHPHLVDMDFPTTGCALPVELLIGGESELASVAFNCGLNGEECPRVNRSQGWSLVSSMFGWIIVGTDTSNETVT